MLEIIYNQIINSNQNVEMLSNALSSLRKLLSLENGYFVRNVARSSRVFDYLLFLIEDHFCCQVRLIAADCLFEVCSFMDSGQGDSQGNSFYRYFGAKIN